MKTVIRIHKGADFSSNNIGTVDLEPAIEVPANGLVFAARLRSSLFESQPYAGQGGVSLADLYANSQFTGRYLVAGTPDSGLHAGNVESPVTTIAAIFRGGKRGLIAGWYAGASSPRPRNAIIFSTAGTLMCVAGKASESVNITGGQSNDWNMVFFSYDSAAGTASAHNMTVGQSQDASGIPVGDSSSPTAFRIGAANDVPNSNGKNDIAWCGLWNRELSEYEMQEVYVSAQEALAPSGIVV